MKYSFREPKSTKRSLWKTKKTDLIKRFHRLRSDHEDHHLTNNIAQALMATSNFAIQSTVGSFPSTTYLGRPNIKTVEQTILHSNLPIAKDQLCQKDNDNASTDIEIASAVSGLPIDVCQQILLQFDLMKLEQKQTLKSPSSSKIQFQRQRSHSTSIIE